MALCVLFRLWFCIQCCNMLYFEFVENCLLLLLTLSVMDLCCFRSVCCLFLLRTCQFSFTHKLSNIMMIKADAYSRTNYTLISIQQLISPVDFIYVSQNHLISFPIVEF